jgi:SAM-dependent methyltransferase
LWVRRLMKMRRTARPGNLLDVGSGTGQFLHVARDYFTEVRGTEVSSSAVAIARSKYGLSLLQGTLDSVSLPAESFDNITAFHVLEHVPNPRAMIRECNSLLRMGGVLVIAVPNDHRPVRSMLRMGLGSIGVRRYRKATRLGLQKIRLDGSMGEIHLSHFSPRVLRHLLADNGFKILKEGLDPYFVPATGLKKLRQNARYLVGCAVQELTGVNIYDTIWMVGQKR